MVCVVVIDCNTHQRVKKRKLFWLDELNKHHFLFQNGMITFIIAMKKKHKQSEDKHTQKVWPFK